MINKSFNTHLKEGLKLIRKKIHEASSKDVGVISSIYMSASYEELRKSGKKLEKVMHLSKKW